MTKRKIFGYIFIVIAIILTIAIIGQFTNFLGAIIGVFKIFSGQIGSFQIGQALGTFIYWLFHISLTIFLYVIGRRWTKKQNEK